MNYRVYTRTEKSLLRGHSVNEDCYMFSEYSFMEDKKIRLLVVADGMGGLEDGDKAARNAVRGFLESFYEEALSIYINADMDGFSLEYTAEKVKRAMIRAVQNANFRVCSGEEAGRATGCTISAICVFEDYAVIVNVGDSPVYFYRRNRENLHLISILQTKAEQDVEAGAYERYSVEYYQNEHRIYCSLGQYRDLREEDMCAAAVGGLRSGDIFLVGSDGAFGRMQEQEIQELIEEYSEEAEGFLLSRLFEIARMDKNDDQTAILYIVQDEEK